MEIRCDQCGKLYRIDESKLPASGQVAVKCIACGNKIKVTVPADVGVKGPGGPIPNSSGPEEPGEGGGPAVDKAPHGDHDDEEFEVEYFDPDTKTAVVYCPDIQASGDIEEKLKGLDFQVRVVHNRGELSRLLRFNMFDLAVVFQNRPEPDERLTEIMDYFHSMDPEARRKILLCYIHLSGNRHDRLDAFQRGVDVCLNPLDIAGLDQLLPQLLKEKQNEYHVFYEVKRKVQEAVI